MICHHCGAEIRIGRYVPRDDECPTCASDVHCCLNCGNYDESAHNRCLEPQAEWVSDREKANFCDFFFPNTRTAGATQRSSDDARKAFGDLFKK